jgi:hypothetical protein
MGEDFRNLFESFYSIYNTLNKNTKQKHSPPHLIAPSPQKKAEAFL